MVNTQIDRVLSEKPGPAVRFTQADQDELASLVQDQMKRAIDSQKRAVREQQESGIYTLLTRESLETYQQINSA